MTHSNARSSARLILLLGAGLLLVTAACGPAPQSAPAPFVEDTYSEITRISLEDARAALDAGSAIFLDVRPAESYQAGHVAGAINIPLAELEARIGELQGQEWIITYCT